jgi:hypothetical protein
MMLAGSSGWMFTTHWLCMAHRHIILDSCLSFPHPVVVNLWLLSVALLL